MVDPFWVFRLGPGLARNALDQSDPVRLDDHLCGFFTLGSKLKRACCPMQRQEHKAEALKLEIRPGL